MLIIEDSNYGLIRQAFYNLKIKSRWLLGSSNPTAKKGHFCWRLCQVPIFPPNCGPRQGPYAASWLCKTHTAQSPCPLLFPQGVPITQGSKITPTVFSILLLFFGQKFRLRYLVLLNPYDSVGGTNQFINEGEDQRIRVHCVGHVANQWQRQNSKPGPTDTKSIFLLLYH